MYNLPVPLGKSCKEKLQERLFQKVSLMQINYVNSKFEVCNNFQKSDKWNIVKSVYLHDFFGSIVQGIE